MVLPVRAVGGLGRLLRGRGHGGHLFAVLHLAAWLATCAALSRVRAGSIYFWLKDITPEFLKMHALFYALDVLQKARPLLAAPRSWLQHGLHATRCHHVKAGYDVPHHPSPGTCACVRRAGSTHSGQSNMVPNFHWTLSLAKQAMKSWLV